MSLDVKNLYTNVKTAEAIESALKELYCSNEYPEIPRSTKKTLLGLAVMIFHFMCKKCGTLNRKN